MKLYVIRRNQNRVATILNKIIDRTGTPVLNVGEITSLVAALAITLHPLYESIPEASPEMQVSAAALALATHFLEKRLERRKK